MTDIRPLQLTETEINFGDEILLSGAQPTGVLHLGNYLGAISQWKKLQHDFINNFFTIVDLHAITIPYDPRIFHDNVIKTAVQYLACGLKSNLSAIFVQSHVKQHTELTWLLNTITPVSWLDKMVQFKEKAKNNRDTASLGLYSYPVLMAADILLYKATKVPVGEDQRQHLELARDIAEKFNRVYNNNYFPLPEALSENKSPVRIMGLKDPTKKMSKSDANDNSRINILDSPEIITKKMKSATTDSIIGFEYEELKNRPAAYNLINIYSLLTNTSHGSICNQFSTFSGLKSALIDVLINEFQPIKQEFERLIKEKSYINQILKDGAEKANKVATKNMQAINQIMGL